MKILCKKEEMEILSGRGVQNLVHFTPLSNLQRILVEGLKPLNAAGEEFACVNQSTRIQADGDLISFSIEYPGYMYLQSLIKKCGEIFVILYYPISIIAEKEVYIYKSNPAIPRWGEAKTFEDLFFEEYRYKKLPPNYPSDPRAEIRMHECIDSSEIQKIVFPSKLEEEISTIQFLVPKVKILVDDTVFEPRIDSDYWINIRAQGLDICPLITETRSLKAVQ